MSVVSIGVQDTSSDVKAQLEGNDIIKTTFAAQLAGVSSFAFSFIELPDADASYDIHYYGGNAYKKMSYSFPYGGWSVTNTDYPNILDAPSNEGPYIYDMEGQEVITIYPHYNSWGSTTAVGISQTIPEMTPGETYTFSLDAAVHRRRTDPDTGVPASNLSSDVSDANLEVYFGGQLAGTLSPNSGTLTNVSLDLIAGSGDGSDLLEVRTGMPDDLADMDTFSVGSFDIQPAS